jgi:hypothetical protein
MSVITVIRWHVIINQDSPSDSVSIQNGQGPLLVGED